MRYKWLLNKDNSKILLFKNFFLPLRPLCSVGIAIFYIIN